MLNIVNALKQNIIKIIYKFKIKGANLIHNINE